MKKLLTIMLAVVALASCGSSKKLAKESATPSGTAVSTVPSKTPVQVASLIQKVYDNEVYAKNIVADLSFTLGMGERKVSVSGSLHMKRDDVIRIQLVAFGLMEVGRLEFTKDYVLILDRYHKRYVKEDYNKVSFLQENGLDFYTLQALLWNQLYVPGNSRVTESLLKEFAVSQNSGVGKSNIRLDRGNFIYNWTADNNTALLENVNVDYKSAAHGNTNVDCKYSKFITMGSKLFPSMVASTFTLWLLRFDPSPSTTSS
ncbi:MAG: DUF4292 domain-containing protein [Bacteroidaceae bacterium]|nr:DUF4292 domain-containing protein [Bacteroidaceae bacterium]